MLRNARAKGSAWIVPACSLPVARVERLRTQGLSWSKIAPKGIAAPILRRGSWLRTFYLLGYATICAIKDAVL